MKGFCKHRGETEFQTKNSIEKFPKSQNHTKKQKQHQGTCGSAFVENCHIKQNHQKADGKYIRNHIRSLLYNACEQKEQGYF